METGGLNANYLSTEAKIELSLFLFSRGLYKNSADAIVDIENDNIVIIEYSDGNIMIRIQGKQDWLI